MRQLKTLLTALVLTLIVMNVNAQLLGYSRISVTITAPSFPYTWPVSGQSYPAPGTYYFDDTTNRVYYTLDLREQGYAYNPSIINATGFPYTWSVSGQSCPGPGIYTYRDTVNRISYSLDLRDPASIFAPLKETYTYTADSFYTYTIPRTSWYFIEASGAQGGSADAKVGGKGARVQGYVRLLTGQQVRIGVGKAGSAGTNDGDVISGGGGGGASSVVLVDGTTYTPLLMAGGGGGAGKDQNGLSGLITPKGGLDWGGSNGGGGGLGADSDFRGGAGGGGFNGNGQSHLDNDGTTLLSQGGKSYINGNMGGNGNTANSIGGNGGWGGGGEVARQKMP